MFTGLIRAVGEIVGSKPLAGGAKELTVDISGLEIVPETGASIAINGACQTVTSYANGLATFCAVEETVKRTTLGRLGKGTKVNLEPSLKVGESLDGHFVLGHVDGVGSVAEVILEGSSEIWHFTMPENLKPMIAEKGSIAIDGISLTVADVYEDTFTVSLIPHTADNTRLGFINSGDEVNLEVDVLARYMARQLGIIKDTAENSESRITTDFLAENGFI